MVLLAVPPSPRPPLFELAVLEVTTLLDPPFMLMPVPAPTPLPFELAVLLVRVSEELLLSPMPPARFKLTVLFVRVLFEPPSRRMPPPPAFGAPLFKMAVLESRVL